MIQNKSSNWQFQRQQYYKQWRSQNTEKVMHIKGRLLDQAMILFQLRPFSKWELLLKERICSKREQILSFMSSSLYSQPSL